MLEQVGSSQSNGCSHLQLRVDIACNTEVSKKEEKWADRLEQTDHQRVVGRLREAQRVDVREDRIELGEAAGKELRPRGRPGAQFGRLDGSAVCKRSTSECTEEAACRSSRATAKRPS